MTGPDDDPLEALAADPALQEAGAQYRAALRAEAAAYEELAARDLLRGRRLSDVAREACARGDRVALVLPQRSFVGTVEHVAGDLACLRTPAGIVDVSLRAPITLQVVEQVRQGGHAPGPGPASFTARLFEHEAAGTFVELGGRFPGGAVVARIEAVALDHVVLRDRAERTSYVAHAALDYVAPGRSA